MKRNKKSFMKRISKNMIILILISYLLTYLFAYMFFYHSTYENTKLSGQNMIIANLQVVDQYFEQIDQIANAIIYNESLNNVMKAQKDTSGNMQILKNIEQTYYHSRSDLRLVFYKENSSQNVYSIYTGSYYEKIDDFKKSYWYQQLQKSKKKKVLLTNIYADGEPDNGQFVHSVFYQIDDLYGNNPVGYLRIDMNLAELREKLMLDYMGVEGAQILSQDGEVLFRTGNIGDVDNEKWKTEEDLDKVHEISSRNSLLYYGVSEETDWIVMIGVSKNELYRQEIVIGSIFLTVLLLTLAVCLTVVDRNSVILNRNMLRLKEGMNAIKEGNLTAQVSTGADDEIEKVIDEFNEMSRRIHKLIGEIEAKQTLLSEAQIKALQQQINPHFMYNSLETLMGMASEGKCLEIIKICQCISSMLRYNTKMTGYSTIGAEVAQVQSYMNVMAFRMQGSIDTQYEIDPNCMDAKIVKFSFQPLVENAIVHGLRNKVRGAVVSVSVQKKDSGVEIRILDNGAGIIPAKLKKLQELLAEDDENYLKMMEGAGHTGLLNVHLRLKLYFGKEYHSEIKSEMGKGTEIRIRIPYRKEMQACTES